MQSIYDQTVPITLTNQKNVATSYSSAQATTELDRIRERYTTPASKAMSSAAESLAFSAVYRDIYSSIGTPGTTPSTTLGYLQAGTKLTDLACELDDRVAVLDPLAMQTIANTTSLLFGAQYQANYKAGQFAGQQLGISAWYQDAVRPTHTTGTFTASTPLVNGANQTGSTININGWASGATTLKRGDIFTIAGVNSVNPLAYTSTGRLQQFVVTADTSDSTGTTATLPISPSIITSGQLQTVDASPAASAVVTVLGATSAAGGTLATTLSPQSFVYHPDAFAFVMADLMPVTAGAKSTPVRSTELGFMFRYVEQYQIATDQQPNRMDMLIGAATLQARLACRVWG